MGIFIFEVEVALGGVGLWHSWGIVGLDDLSIFPDPKNSEFPGVCKHQGL